MDRLSLIGAKFCLVYLTIVSALGYIFPVGKVTPVRSVMDAFLLLAVVCVFVPKPVFRIIAGVAGVIDAAIAFHLLDPFLRFALSGVGSIWILIGPWSIPGMPGVLLVVAPLVLSFVSCVIMLFYAERALGKSGVQS